ncbi:aminotransferase-like domain-containing protein [Aliihoeflea sp. PC F10.4]
MDGALDAICKAVREDRQPQPVYVRIANALSSHISDGNLKHRAKLPSHRVLAEALGVNVTTVTKAVRFLKDRGVVSAKAGQGTIVRGKELDHMPPVYERLRTLPRNDLSVVKRQGAVFGEAVSAAIERVVGNARTISSLREYQPSAGSTDVRHIGSLWLTAAGVNVACEQIAITAGAQHALFVALGATMKPGDVVLVPSIAYQGIKSAAQMLGLGLIGVDVDDEGIIVQEIERHAHNPRVRSIYLIPTLDNPRSVTLPLERRKAIAEIADRCALNIIEDDIYRPLSLIDLPSMIELYPERTFHVSSVGKVLAPGLRCGFLAYPAVFRENVMQGLRATVWMVDPITVRVVQDIISGDSIRDLVTDLQELLVKRHRAAIELLGNWISKHCRPEGNCLWVSLPPEIKAHEMTEYLRMEGVGVVPSTVFTTGSAQTNALRLYKGSATDDACWEDALVLIQRAIEA